MAAINYGRRRPGRNAEIPKGGLNQLARMALMGGAGGGLGEGELQGPALGTDEVIDGELVDNDLAPTALSATTLPEPPRKKMGVGDHILNVFTKGQHGQGFQSYNNAVDRAAYEAELRGIIGQQQAASAMERAKAVQAAMDAREAAAFQNTLKQKEIEEGIARRTEMFKDSNVQVQEKLKQQLAIDKAKAEEAIKNHLSPDLFESLVPLGQEKLKFGLAETRAKNVGAAQPAFIPAVIDSMMADYAKQGFINKGTQATTQNTLADVATKNAELPTKGFLQVQERGAAVNPLTGQVIRHAPALDFDPRTDGGLMGGVTSSFLGGGRVVPKVTAGMSLAPQPADVTTEQDLSQAAGTNIYAPDGGQQEINPTALNQIIEMFSPGFNPNRRKAFPGRY